MKKNNFSKIVYPWIEKAENDLSFAKKAFEDTEYYDHICFLSHQAVEKYLKAFLIKSKGEITKKEKIHDLAKLADWCKEFGLYLGDYYIQLRTLTEFYMPAKYPDAAFGKFSKKDAQESVKIAEEIVKAIKEKLFE